MPRNYLNNAVRLFLLVLSGDVVTCSIIYDEVLGCARDQTSYDAASRSRECKGSSQYVYHCLKDTKGRLIETCADYQWIPEGNCPLIILASGNFEGENCTGQQGCPRRQYQSFEVYKYPICFKERTSPKQTTTSTTTVNVLSTSTTATSTTSTTSTNHTGQSGQQSSHVITIITAVVGIFVPGMVIGILIIYYKRCGGTTKHDNDTDVEAQPLMEKSDTPHTFKNDIFMETEAYRKCKKTLSQNDVVIITGILGSGKSTVLQHLVQELEKEDNWRKVTSDHLKWTKKSRDQNIVMLWDDCGGQYNVNHVKETQGNVREILNWVQEKDSDGKRKAVIAMSQAASNCIMHDETVYKFKCKVNLDELNEKDKVELHKCISDWRCPCVQCKGMKMADMSELVSTDPSYYIISLGWPLVCRLAAVAKVVKDIEVFCKRPSQQLFQAYDVIKKERPLLYGILVYLVSNRGQGNLNYMRFNRKFLGLICKEDITASTDEERKNLSEELKSMLDTVPELIQSKSPDWYVFWHEVISLTIFCHYYGSDTDAKLCVVKNWDLTMLTELLRPAGYDQELYEQGISYLLEEGSEHIEDISSQTRLSTHLSNTYVTSVSSHSPVVSSVTVEASNQCNTNVTPVSSQSSVDRTVMSDALNKSNTSLPTQSPKDKSLKLDTPNESNTKATPMSSQSPVDNQVTTDASNKSSSSAAVEVAEEATESSMMKWCLELPKQYWEVFIERLIPEYHRYQDHCMMTVPEFKQIFEKKVKLHKEASSKMSIAVYK